MKTLMMLLLLIAPSMASAQVLLKNAQIYTDSGELITTNILTNKQGRIVSVDTVILAAPEMEVIDCEGKIVTPGLVEVGTSLGLVEIWSISGTRDEAANNPDQIRAAFSAADGINPDSMNFAVARSGGITSVLSNPGGALVAGQSAWLDLGSETARATLVKSHVAMHIGLGERGSRDSTGSRAQALLTLRELYDDAAFYSRNQRAFDENRSRKLGASRLDLLALRKTVEGMPVVFDAHRASDIEQALRFAADLNLKPIIRGGTEAWKVKEMLAKGKVPVIINPIQNLPSKFDRLGARDDNAVLLAEAGVPIIFSTFDVHRARTLRQIAGNAVRAGLPHLEAVKAITSNPAAAFGMSDHGSIAVGKVGNLVVWSGDPLELSSWPEHVIVGGRNIGTRSRQSELFKKYRTLERRGSPAEAPEQFREDQKADPRGNGPPPSKTEPLKITEP